MKQRALTFSLLIFIYLCSTPTICAEIYPDDGDDYRQTVIDDYNQRTNVKNWALNPDYFRRRPTKLMIMSTDFGLEDQNFILITYDSTKGFHDSQRVAVYRQESPKRFVFLGEYDIIMYNFVFVKFKDDHEGFISYHTNLSEDKNEMTSRLVIENGQPKDERFELKTKHDWKEVFEIWSQPEILPKPKIQEINFEDIVSKNSEFGINSLSPVCQKIIRDYCSNYEIEKWESYPDVFSNEPTYFSLFEVDLDKNAGHFVFVTWAPTISYTNVGYQYQVYRVKEDGDCEWVTVLEEMGTLVEFTDGFVGFFFTTKSNIHERYASRTVWINNNFVFESLGQFYWEDNPATYFNLNHFYKQELRDPPYWEFTPKEVKRFLNEP